MRGGLMKALLLYVLRLEKALIASEDDRTTFEEH
jgi:hypothetical protein